MNFPLKPPLAATRRAWILLGLILPPLAPGVSQSLTPHVYSWRYGISEGSVRTLLPEPPAQALAGPRVRGDGADPASPESRPPRAPQPGAYGYLGVIGPPPLRFMEPESPLEPPGPPPAPEAAKPKVIEKVAATSITPDVVVNPGIPDSARKTSRQEQVTSAGAPPPLIPDDSSPRVRPEDFLPFFQFPGSRRGLDGGSIPAPATPAAPSTLQPSSASFREE